MSTRTSHQGPRVAVRQRLRFGVSHRDWVPISIAICYCSVLFECSWNVLIFSPPKTVVIGVAFLLYFRFFRKSIKKCFWKEFQEVFVLLASAPFQSTWAFHLSILTWGETGLTITSLEFFARFKGGLCFVLTALHRFVLSSLLIWSMVHWPYPKHNWLGSSFSMPARLLWPTCGYANEATKVSICRQRHSCLHMCSYFALLTAIFRWCEWFGFTVRDATLLN